MPLTISSLFAFLILCSSSSLLCYCSAVAAITADTINSSDPISDKRGETLVSTGKRFVLGFFTPNDNDKNLSSNEARYVGIWYYNLKPQTVVWVANRDQPLSHRNGYFRLTETGNLQVLDEVGTPYWSTNLPKRYSGNKTAARATLLDSGNLVLRVDHDQSAAKSSLLWESFKFPTDTFLPGMKMTENLRLTSWNSSSNNPAIGAFTFQQDQDQYIITQKKSIQYWKSGVTGKFIASDDIKVEVTDLLSGSTTPPLYRAFTPTRLVMNSSGQIQYYYWDTEAWEQDWMEPRDRCSVFNTCGNFGCCNTNRNSSMMCKCLPGFEPSSPAVWESGDFSGGCVRKSPICGLKNEKIDHFVSLKMMRVGKPDLPFNVMSEKECRNECVNNCKCQAYSYDEAGFGNATAQCWTWSEDLNNLQDNYTGGHDLYVRVPLSDIESTRRNCETCGTNIISYPLSTQRNCGDPMYYGFHCDNSTGQVTFEAPGGTYPVISINSKTQKFVIQAKNANYCDQKHSKGEFLQLSESSQFHVEGNYCIYPNNTNKGGDELEISWNPPQEPTCTSSTDCKDWPDSTCNERNGTKRCLCNANFQWNSSSINCTQLVAEGSSVKPLEEPASSSKMSKSLIIGIAIASVIVLIVISCAIVYISYLWKRRLSARQENRENIQRNQALYGSERHVKDLIDMGEFREEDKKGIDVPFFDLETILVATDNFSDANKLGRGGFGPVYKGILAGGREVAVKRLSSVSRQGLEEFKNEVILIAKLQHRNLVRLLGYCFKGEEMILLYEYMPNKSLDSFIFDRTLCTVLNWELRFNIILGIARGLLYLHQDSRLRIIHRDLKTSNILLDDEMNSKISDFGLARIFEGKQIEGSTNRVVGTYGYMSPEYALDGFFSVKSDVFSFGVVVLEIISGRKNTGFYPSKQTLSLLGYAWKLWNEDKALDLMDETLYETCNRNEFLRCINVGLLCVQEDANDRPTMSNVVFMLGNEAATLPTPKQPAFIVRRDPPSIASSSTKPETLSNRELTVTVEGR